MQENLKLDGEPVVCLESAHLQMDVAPGVGGRIVSLRELASGHEFLWRNRSLSLQRLPAGSEYDPNFFGGIDELLPNDLPEVIDGVNCPDHGELWTTPLEWEAAGQGLKLRATLPLTGLCYEREVALRPDQSAVEMAYRLSNPTPRPRHFLWKLHAALAVADGDVIECPARKGQVVDLAWSRFHTLAPFDWPRLEGRVTNVVPPPEGTVDFFYLFDLQEGILTWRRPGQGLRFAYEFDRKVFPFAWLFASYGGFNGHYTVILEPCTTMPISVNDAAARNQCSLLQPGEALETRVVIRAGRDTPSSDSNL